MVTAHFGLRHLKNVVKLRINPNTDTIPQRITRNEGKKLNPQEDTENQINLLELLKWTDTLPVKAEKQAIEEILVDYRDFFARHRMDIGMNLGGKTHPEK